MANMSAVTLRVNISRKRQEAFKSKNLFRDKNPKYLRLQEEVRYSEDKW